jgi:hypothetical protein
MAEVIAKSKEHKVHYPPLSEFIPANNPVGVASATDGERTRGECSP